jgi:hypothetical protein
MCLLCVKFKCGHATLCMIAILILCLSVPLRQLQQQMVLPIKSFKGIQRMIQIIRLAIHLPLLKKILQRPSRFWIRNTLVNAKNIHFQSLYVRR